MSIKSKTDKMCVLMCNRKMKKIFQMDGKQKKSNIKKTEGLRVIRPTMDKMWILLCTTLLIQAIIPEGWKVIKNFEEK